METVYKCFTVACWNYCKKRKYIKELSGVNASVQKFLCINVPMNQYKNTTLVQVQLKDIAKMLERITTGKRNASLRIFNQSQYKVSDAAAELKKIVQSLPRRIFLYLRAVFRIPRWGVTKELQTAIV
ncbi:hypothetical protein REPUB_Repub10bG0150000 [Reevesia pubescens]